VAVLHTVVAEQTRLEVEVGAVDSYVEAVQTVSGAQRASLKAVAAAA
jgi:hypothetical protein